MYYLVDYHKPARELLLGLINHDNASSLRPDQIDWGLPNKLPSGENGGTSLPIVTHKEHEYTLTYVRMDLAKIFNFTEIRISGNTDTDESKAKIIEDIAVKYKIHLLPEDVELTLIREQLYLSARNESLAYIGKYPIELDVTTVEPGGPEISYIYASGVTRRAIRPVRRFVKSDNSFNANPSLHLSTVNPVVTNNIELASMMIARNAEVNISMSIKDMIIKSEHVVTLNLFKKAYLSPKNLDVVYDLSFMNTLTTLNKSVTKAIKRTSSMKPRIVQGYVYTLAEEIINE